MDPTLDGQAMLNALNTLGVIAQARSMDELLSQWESPAELLRHAMRAVDVCESMFSRATEVSGVANLAQAKKALAELRQAIDGESLEQLGPIARRFTASMGASLP